MKRVAGMGAVIALLCAGLATAQTQRSTPAPTEKSSAPTAQTTPQAGPVSTLVAVILKIRTHAVVSRRELETAMASMVPEAQAVPGLVRKYSMISDDQEFGGIYLWQNRQTAETYFNDNWRAKMAKKYGAPPEISYFDVPIAIEGVEFPKVTFGVTAADAAASKLVAVLVEIPIPAQGDRARLEAGMARTVPEFEALPGLVRKYYTISDDQKFGGIYLWVNRQAAEAHFNDEWRARMVKTFGAPAEVTYFDVPIVVDGPAAQKSVSPSAMATP